MHPSVLERRGVFAVLVVACIAPLAFVGLAPLVDLFGHAGRFAVQTELATSPELQRYFGYEWKLIGNLGTDLLVEALYPLFGVEQSARIVVVFTQALAACGILMVSRALYGAITPYALFALPLIYGFPFQYGFLNFSLAMALALIAFAIWVRLGKGGHPALRALFLGSAGLIVWLCHAFGWGFLGLLCGAYALCGQWHGEGSLTARASRIVISCAPLLLPLIAMLAWRSDAAGAETGDWSFQLKILWLASALRARFVWLDIASLAALTGVLYLSIRSKWAMVNRPLMLAAGLSLLVFLLLPARVFGSYFADMRMVPYMLVLGLLALRPNDRRAKALTWAAIAFFAIRMVITAIGLMAADREVQQQLPALDHVPRGGAVASIVIEPCDSRWALPVLRQIGGLATMRNHAFANVQWTIGGMNPLSIHYPVAEPFIANPSQMVLPDDCAKEDNPRLSVAMAQLPRAAFSHVWIVGELPEVLPEFSQLTLIERGENGAIFQVNDR